MKMLALTFAVLFAVGSTAQERKIASPETQKRGFSAGDDALNPSMAARRQAANTRLNTLTVDICRADLSTWGNDDDWADYINQLIGHQSDEANVTNRLEKISVEETTLRYNELKTCTNVDEINKTKYHDIASRYDFIETRRMYSFMVRHNLWRQFKTEDEAGIRGFGNLGIK